MTDYQALRIAGHAPQDAVRIQCDAQQGDKIAQQKIADARQEVRRRELAPTDKAFDLTIGEGGDKL